MTKNVLMHKHQTKYQNEQLTKIKPIGYVYICMNNYTAQFYVAGK